MPRTPKITLGINTKPPKVQQKTYAKPRGPYNKVYYEVEDNAIDDDPVIKSTLDLQEPKRIEELVISKSKDILSDYEQKQQEKQQKYLDQKQQEKQRIKQEKEELRKLKQQEKEELKKKKQQEQEEKLMKIALEQEEKIKKLVEEQMQKINEQVQNTHSQAISSTELALKHLKQKRFSDARFLSANQQMLEQKIPPPSQHKYNY